jgi:hypothetical protein
LPCCVSCAKATGITKAVARAAAAAVPVHVLLMMLLLEFASSQRASKRPPWTKVPGDESRWKAV